MKFAHIADLHLGLTLLNHSLIEDQRFILNQMMDILQKEEVDALLMAGDIYDKGIPSVEATQLLNQFLTELNRNQIKVFLIAGNHDQGERLSFGREILEQANIHLVGTYQGELKPFVVEDEYGKINIYCLPFIRPANVNRYIENEKDKTTSYQEAFDYVLKGIDFKEDERNVLIAHQFVSGIKVDKEGSEELIVGGIEQVSSKLLEKFDYVALGHIHRPQKVKNEFIRYAGSPLPYSFAEATQQKTMPIITLNQKNDTHIELKELQPYHKMVELTMSFRELLKPETISQYQNDYLHITLNDEYEIDHASLILRQSYPHLLRLDYQRIHQEELITLKQEEIKLKTPVELFDDFFYQRNQKKMSKTQKEYLTEVIDTLKEVEE